MKATADFVTWTSLGSATLSGGSYNFVDSGARSLAQRFYATKEGNTVSSNTYGFVNVTIPAGVGTITLIANQLNNSSGNTVGALLQNVPNSTKVEKFIAATQSWGPVSFYSALSNTWSAGGASFTMNPGEGILVQNHVATNFTVTFIGDVPKAPQVNSGIPGTSGQFAMISSIVPLSTNLNGMAFPAVNGDVASRWNVGTQQYDTNTFSSGAWSPLVPTPNVGEAFFITSGTSSSRTWTENVNISPP